MNYVYLSVLVLFLLIEGPILLILANREGKRRRKRRKKRYGNQDHKA